MNIIRARPNDNLCEEEVQTFIANSEFVAAITLLNTVDNNFSTMQDGSLFFFLKKKEKKYTHTVYNIALNNKLDLKRHFKLRNIMFDSGNIRTPELTVKLHIFSSQ